MKAAPAKNKTKKLKKIKKMVKITGRNLTKIFFVYLSNMLFEVWDELFCLNRYFRLVL